MRSDLLKKKQMNLGQQKPINNQLWIDNILWSVVSDLK